MGVDVRNQKGLERLNRCIDGFNNSSILLKVGIIECLNFESLLLGFADEQFFSSDRKVLEINNTNSLSLNSDFF